MHSHLLTVNLSVLNSCDTGVRATKTSYLLTGLQEPFLLREKFYLKINRNVGTFRYIPKASHKYFATKTISII